MTSWNRGKENEEMGEEEMNSPNVGEKMKGMGHKVEGEAEQGINNVGDTLTGKQHDLQGKRPDYGKEARQWTDSDNDMDDMGDMNNDMTDSADRADDLRRNID